MTERLNRTADWQRLKNNSFVTIEDHPGRIVISRVSPAEKIFNRLLIGAIAFPIGLFVVGQAFGGAVGAWSAGIVGSIFASIIIFCGVIPGRMRLAKFADCVIFAPEGLLFLRGGVRVNALQREGMQQIVADSEDRLRYHRFIADTGYMSAFPMSDATDHLLINNILIAAFSQPVHLDQRQDAAPAYEPPPPTVGGLAAAPSIELKPIA